MCVCYAGEMLNEHNEKEIAAEGFRSSISTKEMRADLASRGVAPADETEKVKMAVLFMDWVQDYLPDRHAGIAWLLVFKEIDDDASGLLTFDELRMVIRHRHAAPLTLACTKSCCRWSGRGPPIAHRSVDFSWRTNCKRCLLIP